jgi:hypothetical protein
VKKIDVKWGIEVNNATKNECKQDFNQLNSKGFKEHGSIKQNKFANLLSAREQSKTKIGKQ